MHWKKLGLIYSPSGNLPWARSHAMIPTPIRLDEETIRIFLTFCDSNGLGRPGYIDVLANNPKHVIGSSDQPLFSLGKPGTFDENGILTCSVVDLGNNRIFLYYVGFEIGTKIRYRLLTGLAVSEDGGKSFNRYSEVPVLERSNSELYFRGGPWCMHSDKIYRLWYVAGSSWSNIAGKSMPMYDIRYIESVDGINWPGHGEVQIGITKPDEHGFGRPAIIQKPDNSFRMFYSIRRRSFGAYRLGYAESLDGKNWQRMDEKLNLDVSANSFDSDAIMYAAPIMVDDKLYVFYNGNDFGKDGVALAILESE